MSREKGAGDNHVLLFGGGLGYVFGVYAHGVAYTLLSINDHLAAMRGIGGAPSAAVGAPSPAPAYPPRKADEGR